MSTEKEGKLAKIHYQLRKFHRANRLNQEQKAVLRQVFQIRRWKRASFRAMLRKRQSSSQYWKRAMYTNPFILGADTMDAEGVPEATVLLYRPSQIAQWVGRAAKLQIGRIFRCVHKSPSPLQNRVVHCDEHSFLQKCLLERVNTKAKAWVCKETAWMCEEKALVGDVIIVCAEDVLSTVWEGNSVSKLEELKKLQSRLQDYSQEKWMQKEPRGKELKAKKPYYLQRWAEPKENR